MADREIKLVEADGPVTFRIDAKFLEHVVWSLLLYDTEGHNGKEVASSVSADHKPDEYPFPEVVTNLKNRMLVWRVWVGPLTSPQPGASQKHLVNVTFSQKGRPVSGGRFSYEDRAVFADVARFITS